MKDLGLRITPIPESGTDRIAKLKFCVMRSGWDTAQSARCAVCGGPIQEDLRWFDLDLNGFVHDGDCAKSLHLAEIYLRGVLSLSVPT